MVLLHALLSAIASVSQPALIKAEDCQFEDAYAFESTSCSIRLINRGTEEVAVKVFPSQAEGGGNTDKVIHLLPGRSVDVPVRVEIGNSIGEIVRLFKISPIGDKGETVTARATGFAMSALNEVRPTLKLGDVDTSAPTESKTLDITSDEAATFRLSKVISSPKGIRAELENNGHVLRVSIMEDAEWGMLDGLIKIAAEGSRQREVWVNISGSLHGEVSVPSNPISFGVLAPNTPHELNVPLTNRNGKDFKIGKIEIEGNIVGDTYIHDCKPSLSGCKTIEFKLSDRQPPGYFRGSISVYLPDYGKDLPISVYGFLQSASAVDEKRRNKDKHKKDSEVEKIRSGEVKKGAPSENQKIIKSSEEGRKLEAASKHEENNIPSGRGPLLKWAVTQEDGVHGYQIFRSPSAEGRFNLLTSKVIKKNSSESGSSSYSWRDTSAKIGKEYWYYVGIVYIDGRKEKLTPPRRALAK